MVLELPRCARWRCATFGDEQFVSGASRSATDVGECNFRVRLRRRPPFCALWLGRFALSHCFLVVKSVLYLKRFASVIPTWSMFQVRRLWITSSRRPCCMEQAPRVVVVKGSAAGGRSAGAS